jgi:tetratricopeptide (TPR) repeat protein
MGVKFTHLKIYFLGVGKMDLNAKLREEENMIKKLAFIILAALFCGTVSFACINTDIERLNDGTILWVDDEGLVPKGHKLQKFDYDKKLLALQKQYNETKKVNFLIDAGVIMIMQKKYEDAKENYLKIEQLEPNRYATASNLGTVYELLGDNQNALVWIKKAVEINPQSHQGSEWLHVKILEAKINGDQSITSDFLINANFGTNPNPAATLTKGELLNLREALFFQLNERVTFIKPKDKIVANLLFDLANINYLLDQKADAITIYEKAREYGFADTILQSRLENAKGIPITEKPGIVEDSKPNNSFLWIAFGVTSLAIIAFTALFVRKRRA